VFCFLYFFIKKKTKKNPAGTFVVKLF